jgi:hypothetical protein
MKFCNNCNKILVKYQKKFCSTKCSAIVTNKNKHHSIETKIKISLSQGGKGIIKTGFCLYCKTKINSYKFCNNTCKTNYIQEDREKKWLNGKLDGNSKSGHADYIKKYLLKRYNNKCSICGWGETNKYTKTIPLEVEHIDGNCYNNSYKNVTLLCPNCHSLTKTFRGANKGNGRRSYLKDYYIKDNDGKII